MKIGYVFVKQSRELLNSEKPVEDVIWRGKILYKKYELRSPVWKERD